jgi:hypothetical protein
VGYRDDVDALYMRTSALERELERAQAELAQRDAELAAMRGPNRQWRETPRPLRELPAAETTLAQLIDTFVRPTAVPPPKPKAAKPPPITRLAEWSGAQRARLFEATRDRLRALDLECLVLVGAIVEQLALEPESRDELGERLREIVRAISENRS